MNHPRDVRAGRVPGRLGCIFSLHVLEFDCFLGGEKTVFRSECLALATLGALLPAPHGIARLANTGLWQRGKEEEGQAVPHSPCSALPLQRTLLRVQALPCAHCQECRGTGMATWMRLRVGCSPFCWPRPAAVAWGSNTWIWSQLGRSQEHGCRWGQQDPKLHLYPGHAAMSWHTCQRWMACIPPQAALRWLLLHPVVGSQPAMPPL